uniref:HNH endonuclease n=1 Tax=Steinernema glaseri TaxID=37863 RepID=A0A1I8ABL2_9BILA
MSQNIPSRPFHPISCARPWFEEEGTAQVGLSRCLLCEQTLAVMDHELANFLVTSVRRNVRHCSYRSLADRRPPGDSALVPRQR